MVADQVLLVWIFIRHRAPLPGALQRMPQQAGEGVRLFARVSKPGYLGRIDFLTQKARARRAGELGGWNSSFEVERPHGDNAPALHRQEVRFHRLDGVQRAGSLLTVNRHERSVAATAQTLGLRHAGGATTRG